MQVDIENLQQTYSFLISRLNFRNYFIIVYTIVNLVHIPNTYYKRITIIHIHEKYNDTYIIVLFDYYINIITIYVISSHNTFQISEYYTRNITAQ